MDDEQIIKLFFARDERAIQETASAYGPKLHQLAYQIMRNQEDAKECVNDTYLKAWDTIPPQKPLYFFAYLAKICRNLAFGRLDWHKAAKRRADITVLTAEMEQCIPGKSMEMQLKEAQVGRLLNSFLNGLPKESRLIFMRRYWYADSIKEISRMLGVSESKVKTRLHRTREKLRQYLESEGIEI